MTGATITARLRRLRPARTTVLALAGLAGLELLLVAVYLAVRNVVITDPLVLVYPFVWIDVSILAVWTATTPEVDRRKRLAGLGVAVGYFVVLGYFGGLYGVGSGMAPLHLKWSLPPGYSPVLLYDGAVLRLVLEPYKVVGYLTLAYLVYATVLDAAGAAVSGVVGLFSCVSCSWPILGTVATSVFGSSSAVAAFALSRSYGLSTLIFLSAVALLYYRPLFLPERA
ncbi:MAG: hypothetical protein ABEJ23_01595 [Haloarculaceae archaeon]